MLLLVDCIINSEDIPIVMSLWIVNQWSVIVRDYCLKGLAKLSFHVDLEEWWSKAWFSISWLSIWKCYLRISTAMVVQPINQHKCYLSNLLYCRVSKMYSKYHPLSPLLPPFYSHVATPWPYNLSLASIFIIIWVPFVFSKS